MIKVKRSLESLERIRKHRSTPEYKQYLKNYHKRKYDEQRSKGLCVNCQEEAVPGKACCIFCAAKRSKSVSAKKQWLDKSPEKVIKRRKWTAAYRNRLREQAFKIYGTFCHCCGESQREFLQIDHIKGGGKEHREELVQNHTWIFVWFKKNNYPKGFQTLCCNCNWSKGIWGYCPHQK